MRTAKLLKKNIKGIHMDVTEIENLKNQGTPTLIVLSIAITIVVMLGFATGFQLSVTSVGLFAVDVAAPMLAHLVLSSGNKKVKIIALIITVVGAGAFIAININSFMNGNAGILNSIIGTINKNMAENHDMYVYDESDFDIKLVYAFYTAIAGIVISILVRFKKAYTVAAILIVSTMANMWFKGEANPWFVGSAVVLILAVIYISNIRASQKKKHMVAVWIFASLFAIITSAVILFVHEFKVESVDDFKEEVTYRLENVYFGKSDYPEGTFKRFHEYPAADGETKLKVSLDEPMALHLKGYVGSKYTSRGWENNDEKVYGGDYQGLLDWTNTDGVYPLEQEANFVYNSVDAKEMEEEDVVENNIVVDNQNASQKYQYVTESLKNRKRLTAPKMDVNFVTPIFGKESKYSFSTASIRNDDYLSYLDVKWLNEGDINSANQDKFLRSESNYRNFVKSAYINVPDTEKKILSSNIPECSSNFRDAISTVRGYLKSQIKYSRKVKEYNSDENYLEQVLLKDKRGFSPQFASIATLMFRYYKIPARYVEGYYTSNPKKQDCLKLTSNHAHAWVEVYMNGLGFIPVEVTPGFYKEDNEGGGSSMSSTEPPMGGGGSGGAAKSRRQKDIKQEIKEVLTIVGIIVLAAVLAFIIFLLIRRSLIVNRRNKKLKSDDLDVRVGEATKYMDQMCQALNGNLEDELSEEEIELLEKIKFSDHKITDEENKLITDKMSEVVTKKWKEAKVFRKIKMIVWEGLR